MIKSIVLLAFTIVLSQQEVFGLETLLSADAITTTNVRRALKGASKRGSKGKGKKDAESGKEFLTNV
jgi:hypothetical protein